MKISIEIDGAELAVPTTQPGQSGAQPQSVTVSASVPPPIPMVGASIGAIARPLDGGPAVAMADRGSAMPDVAAPMAGGSGMASATSDLLARAAAAEAVDGGAAPFGAKPESDPSPQRWIGTGTNQGNGDGPGISAGAAPGSGLDGPRS